MDYQRKYLKYKAKYLELKAKIEGGLATKTDDRILNIPINRVPNGFVTLIKNVIKLQDLLSKKPKKRNIIMKKNKKYTSYLAYVKIFQEILKFVDVTNLSGESQQDYDSIHYFQETIDIEEPGNIIWIICNFSDDWTVDCEPINPSGTWQFNFYDMMPEREKFYMINKICKTYYDYMLIYKFKGVEQFRINITTINESGYKYLRWSIQVPAPHE